MGASVVYGFGNGGGTRIEELRSGHDAEVEVARLLKDDPCASPRLRKMAQAEFDRLTAPTKAYGEPRNKRERAPAAPTPEHVREVEALRGHLREVLGEDWTVTANPEFRTVNAERLTSGGGTVRVSVRAQGGLAVHVAGATVPEATLASLAGVLRDL